MPHSVPTVKPPRRPMRFISIDARKVVSAAPTTQPVTGTRGERLVGRELIPGQPVERDDRGVVGEEQGLEGGQDGDVLLGAMQPANLSRR